MRRVRRHAARADGESVFHAGGPHRARSAPELLANGRLKLFLQRVEPLFDWIILDSVPGDSGIGFDHRGRRVRRRSDGRALERDAFADLARRAREEFPDKLLLGVVLNGTSTEKMAQSKYYYGEAVSKFGPS